MEFVVGHSQAICGRKKTGWEQGCREFTAGLSYDMWLLWRNYSSLTLALMSSSLLGGQDGPW